MALEIPEARFAPLCEGSMRGKGGVGLFGDDPLGKTPTRPKSLRDFCRIWPQSEGESFQALSMADFPEGEAGAPYASRWPTLKTESWIWSDKLVA